MSHNKLLNQYFLSIFYPFLQQNENMTNKHHFKNQPHYSEDEEYYHQNQQRFNINQQKNNWNID